MTLMENFGEKLRLLREHHGLTYRQLAAQLGVDNSHLANIEAGRKPLTRILLAKIASALNVRQASIVPAGYFADETEVPA